MKKIKRSYVMEQFYSYEDLMEYLHNNELKTKEFDVSFDDITFQTYDATEGDSLADGGHICLCLPDAEYTIRYCAYRSILDRCCVNGSGFYVIPAEQLAEMLNTFKSKMKTKGVADVVKLIVLDDELIAMLSSEKTVGELGYERLKMDDTLSAVNDGIEMMAVPDDVEGFASVEATVCRWYAKDDDRNIRIDMSSSNIGEGSLSLRADLIEKNVVLPITRTVSVAHRKGVKPSPHEIIDGLTASINPAYSRVDEMKGIRINYPELVIDRIKKDFGVSKKISNRAKESVERKQNTGEKVTAFDVYAAIANTMYNERKHQTDGIQQEAYAAKFLPIMGLDWEKYDQE